MAAALGEKFSADPIIRSTTISGRKWTELSELSQVAPGTIVRIRTRIDTTRACGGSMCFLLLRTGVEYLQALVSASAPDAVESPTEPIIPKEAVKWASKLNPESVVDVVGLVRSLNADEADIASASPALRRLELVVHELHVISAAARVLPFQLADANRADNDESGPKVAIDKRLNTRWLDHRTPAAQSILRYSAAIEREFRSYCEQSGYLGMHTPKLLAGSSEGGAAVFTLQYFGRPACLAQSPQLYKQMAIMSDLAPGVFEVGPVFRAEQAFTHRHLTEFVGLDVEMRIYEHYHEVLCFAEKLFNHIFTALAQMTEDFDVVKRQHTTIEPYVWQVPEDKMEGIRVLSEAEDQSACAAARGAYVATRELRMLRLRFPDGAVMINDALKSMPADEKASRGVQQQDEYEDLSTPNERLLGELVKAKWGVDWYILDQFPWEARPFYTMKHPTEPRLTQSYDMFMRGQEISSGAQRVHDVDMLRTQAAEKEKTLDENYVNAFTLGAWPHGGFGVGLERVVMLYLGLPNVRLVSMYPRDPQRIEP